MQLDAFFCETVGAFGVSNKPCTSMKDPTFTDHTERSSEIMSMPGDRKRKHFGSSSSGSRRSGKAGKNEKNIEKMETQIKDDELRKEDHQLTTKFLDGCNLRQKINLFGSASEKDEEKFEKNKLDSEETDLLADSEINKTNYKKAPESDVDSSSEFENNTRCIFDDRENLKNIEKINNEFNIEEMTTDNKEEKKKEKESPVIESLPENIKSICDGSSANASTNCIRLEDGNKFSIDKICESVPLHHDQERDAIKDSNHITTARQPCPPRSYNDECSSVNENNHFEPAPIKPFDGCAANSKLTKFPIVTPETNKETKCDTVNEIVAQKHEYKIVEEMFTYNKKLNESSVEKESKHSECSNSPWNTTNHTQNYNDASETSCFRGSQSGPIIESGLEGQKPETKDPQMELYTESVHQTYSAHQQPKETRAEEFTNNNEIINSKSEESQMGKLQSEEQQQHIQHHDFSHLSIQNTERQEQYRQFQHHAQQNSFEQMFESEPRVQRLQSESQSQEHSQQYSQEQFYQMRLQQQHHIGQIMPIMPQQHSNLQDSLQDEHLMAYIHHQAAMAGSGHQSRLQQDIYQDLMMDEFQEDANPTTYKLRHLSPTTTKHENQDDGYETSAGDVLTPNSHSSSTHSGTPQLQVSLHAPTSSLALQNVGSTTNCRSNSEQQHSQMPHIQEPNANNMQTGVGTHSSENLNIEETVNITHDSYKFNSNACLNDKVERLFPMQSEQRQNLNSLHAEDLGSIKTDIEIILANKDTMESSVKPPQKRRGRKKKIPIMEGIPSLQSSDINNSIRGDGSSLILKVKERKKHDRFNGMAEEEVCKRTLPDHLCHNLDIVIVGINPGLFAAYKGHHYAGPGNHFWKCLYLSGLTHEQMSADEDYKLMKCGIGFTNMVQRATKGSADLTRKEIKEGSRILLEKLQRFQPKIAVFNGKLIFEVFSGKKDFNFGRQPDCVEGTHTYVWVMPSSSARCAQLPRAADKVPFYAALKKFRDYINGLIPEIDEAECVFTEQRIRQMCEQDQLKNLAQSHNACSYSNETDCPSTSVEQDLQSSREYSAYPRRENQMNPGSVNLSENTIGGPGPPSLISHGSNYMMGQNFPGTPHQTPEKKKRGRPKKLRVQEIIDPTTGQKIQITNPQNPQQPNVNNDYSNILNLSMMSEVPKKKRGRPKKIKALPMEIHRSGVTENSPMMLSNKQSQSLTATQQQSQQISHFNNPPNTGIQQQQMYSSTSPNHSPVPNSTSVAVKNSSVYNPTNNSGSAQIAAATNENSNEIIGNNNKQKLTNSTPPNSPNICAVDFEPPSNREHRSQNDLHSQQLATNLQQRSRFEASHISVDGSANENFNAWMSPSHQFNYQTSLHQDNEQHYQTDHSLSIHHRQQKQVHENQTQQSPHSPWAASHRNSHFELSEGNHHQQQQQQHYMNSMHVSSQHHQQQLQQHEPQQNHLNHQPVQHSSDVATKSLSGLESLVDQIPTIAESEAAAAAVESRLQTLQRGSTPASFGDVQADNYETNIMSENRGSSSIVNTTSLAEAINDSIATSRNSSNGSNTPHYGVSSGATSGSPINHYGLQRHGQTSSAASSPHANISYSGSISSGSTFPLNVSTTQHSPSVASDLLSNAHTPPTMANSNTTTTNSNTTASHHLFSNFSVSNLAASSVTSCGSNTNNNCNKSSDWEASGARSSYHHSNLMAAAALQLHTAAVPSSPTPNPPHQMYIDPHASIHHHAHHSHLSSPHQHHVQVNSLYSSATQAAHTLHHPGMAVAYGAPPSGQLPSHHVHNASGDYGAYGATAAAAAAAHMLHVPNPNFSPYGYPGAPPPSATTQNTYSSWNHHGHPTASSHHPHHLSMFERLKPSDLGSYSSF